MEVVGAVAIALGLAVGLAALVALHVLPTGLSPVRNVVSQYGITPYRSGYRVQTLGYALAGLGAALGLAKLPGPVALLVALCVVFAVARAAISWFPMDAPGSERTATGSWHGVLAIMAFGSVGIAAASLARLLHQDGTHPAVASASDLLAFLMLVAVVAMVASRRLGGEFSGLAERGFYLCMTAWLVVVAILLAHL
jgi:cytochrome bd-type quinol oxidase subunit 2